MSTNADWRFNGIGAWPSPQTTTATPVCVVPIARSAVHSRKIHFYWTHNLFRNKKKVRCDAVIEIDLEVKLFHLTAKKKYIM